ncbi:MAG: cystathionine beta-synthase [Lentisphaerota bacterium]
MQYYESVLEKIGHTPLIKLSKIGKTLDVNLFAKVEYFNPGGSSKDRIALTMIEDAEKRGVLKPGSTIIEATAGNTGAGLAMVAAVKGYRCIFVMPDKMSEEKVNLLKAYGAEVVITPTSVAPDSPQSYNGVADRLAREIPNAFRPGQFTNPKNPEAHYFTTGPEIWNDLNGKIDVFVAGMGTGGTISGVGKFLKERNPNIKIVGADPEGSILSGDTPKSYKVEGIGEDFIPLTFNRQVIDDMVRVSDTEAFEVTRRLAREEGLLVGGSSGTAVAAALRYANRVPFGSNIVILLPDTGRNYLTKIFSDKWMVENGFLRGSHLRYSVGDVMNSKANAPVVVSISPDSAVSEAAKIMTQNNISQLPVIHNGVVVGLVNEEILVKHLNDNLSPDETIVSKVMGASLPQLDEKTDAAELYRLLMAGYNGVLVMKNKEAVGFVTKIDFVNFWAEKINKKA